MSMMMMSSHNLIFKKKQRSIKLLLRLKGILVVIFIRWNGGLIIEMIYVYTYTCIRFLTLIK